MKKWVVIAIAVLVAAGAGTYFFIANKTEGMTDACKEKKIVAFGDSLVAGYGATKGNDFVSVLTRESGIPIVNLGKNGDTTARALERMNLVLAEKPDVVILLLGGNDALRRTPVPETKEHLETIISTLQAQNTQVVLLGVLGGFPADPFQDMFEEISRKYGVEYVPNVLSGILGKQELMSDQVHPNNAGYERVAQKVLPKLLIACGS